jgi:hypothetical protein
MDSPGNRISIARYASSAAAAALAARRPVVLMGEKMV